MQNNSVADFGVTYCKAGLNSSSIHHQLSAAACIIAGSCGEVKRLLLDREEREVRDVPCLNHQMRRVAVRNIVN